MSRPVQPRDDAGLSRDIERLARLRTSVMLDRRIDRDARESIIVAIDVLINLLRPLITESVVV